MQFSENPLHGQGPNEYNGVMPSKSARIRSSNGWKDVQYRSKAKKRVRLALIALGLIVSLLILGQLVNFTQTLFSPWQVNSEGKKYLWDGQFNINILLRSNPPAVFSYNPKDQKITLIKIPAETYLEVNRGFGSWQVRAIYELGQSSKIGGNVLLKESLASFLGVPIDGYLEPTGVLETRQAEQILVLMRQSPFNIFFLLTNLKTDLSLWELIRLKLALWGVRFDKVKILDPIKLNILDQQQLADGSLALWADPLKIDSMMSDFADPNIKDEHLSIAVFNATNYPALAQKAKRLITNMGGNVIIIGNAVQRADKTKVLGKPSNTLKRLIQIFGCSNCDKIDIQDLGLDSSRSEVNLLLGEDFYQKLTNK